MIDYQKYINALRKCAKEHENDKTFTGHVIVSDLCKDTANLLEELAQESRFIPTSERLPNKNQWVLVTTDDYPKLFEVMCYQGIRIGRHDIGNGWEEYEYPSWTSGHGDIQSSHPKAWMPLPNHIER